MGTASIVARLRGIRGPVHRGSTGALRLESTPFYLYLPAARRRIAEELPDARLLVVIRDPIDRAYSNWMHLWVDGLEPIGDFVDAWRAEDERVAAGWAPFWHYRRLGRYGEQWPTADRVDRERCGAALRAVVSRPTGPERVARSSASRRPDDTVPPDTHARSSGRAQPRPRRTIARARRRLFPPRCRQASGQ